MGETFIRKGDFQLIRSIDNGAIKLNMFAMVSLGWSSSLVLRLAQNWVKGNVPDVSMRLGQSASINRSSSNLALL